ncbi:MAG: hypothetical protein JSW45_11750 [Thiotrichales bacterium]|nr:MAG: hypothetical protein JSW45_11750 [Thiotrichales bacterium]
MFLRNLIMTFFLAAGLLASGIGNAAPPETVDGVTTIHLDEYNGYFTAQETLAGLKPGKYRFVVSNKADKLVGFLLQDGVTHQQIDMFPLEPGESRTVIADISGNGFRYRCPINPTPWYEVGVSQ